jgi:predicted DCC family thiol-disulfide oxidoreductase YuxK
VLTIAGRDRRVFYYDGGCGLCRSVVAVMSRLDIRRRVAWAPYQSLEAPPRGLTWEDLERSARLETGQSGHHEGFYAFRRLTLLLPPLWPLAPILWLPGVPGLGTGLYRWTAGHRYGISGCRLSMPRRASGREQGGP